MEVHIVRIGDQPFLRFRDDLSCGHIYEEMSLEDARAFSRRLHMAVMRASRKPQEDK